MKIGIIICDRYKSCDGGKCFRSLLNREGAFAQYDELELVGYSSCGGCPGGNIENVVNGMKKHGADAIHLASGFLAGYPPCPYIDTFTKYIKEQTNLKVVVGTHPMPTNYIEMHKKLQDWTEDHWNYLNEWNLMNPEESQAYDSSQNNYTEKLKKDLAK